MGDETLDLFAAIPPDGGRPPPPPPPPAEPPDTLPLDAYAERAYLAYAMSVVRARALPQVEDGLKPVQRRILHAMNEMRLAASAKHVKSARVVGDVIGKYHPHGDSSVYDAMVRVAQDFTLRYPLVDGQGNFGSRDGDGAAAMRYTECRLAPIAELLLAEIDRGTVDFVPNYDGAFSEPRLLPARLPFVLLNGASGIAVGMATEIPPHNLREVAEAARLLIKKPEASLDELPHGVSTAQVLAEIEALTNPQPRAGRKEVSQEQKNLKQLLLGVLETVRDEATDQAPVRIVLEPRSSRLAQDEFMAVLLAHTSLEAGVPLNFTMMGHDGRPQQKGLRAILSEWIEFRFETVERRSRHRLDEVARRLHVLEGRMIAFLSIEEVIRVIRASDEPKADLMARFALSAIQAEDILEIRLRQLARLEGLRIEKEAGELRAEQDDLRRLLDDRRELTRLILREIGDDARRYGDERRTVIAAVAPILPAEIAVADEPLTVILSKNGWVRARQGHGFDANGITYKSGDFPFAVFETRTIWPLLVIDSHVRAYTVRVADIPGGRGDGVPIATLVYFQEGGRFVRAISAAPETRYLFAGSGGYGFVAPLAELVSNQRRGKAFMTLVAGEAVLAPAPLAGDSV